MHVCSVCHVEMKLPKVAGYHQYCGILSTPQLDIFGIFAQITTYFAKMDHYEKPARIFPLSFTHTCKILVTARKVHHKKFMISFAATLKCYLKACCFCVLHAAVLTPMHVVVLLDPGLSNQHSSRLI